MYVCVPHFATYFPFELAIIVVLSYLNIHFVPQQKFNLYTIYLVIGRYQIRFHTSNEFKSKLNTLITFKFTEYNGSIHSSFICEDNTINSK